VDQNISDEIENILNSLSCFNDDEIEKAINILFSEDLVLADLDASGICILLANKKQSIEGIQTTWFDMENK